MIGTNLSTRPFYNERLVHGLLTVAALAVAGVPAHFMQYPDIRGDVIVFTYEGDLWRVPAAGGTATRLTTYPAGHCDRMVAASK